MTKTIKKIFLGMCFMLIRYALFAQTPPSEGTFCIINPSSAHCPINICAHLPYWPSGSTCSPTCGTPSWTDCAGLDAILLLPGQSWCWYNPSTDQATCFGCDGGSPTLHDCYVTITNVGDNSDCSCEPCINGVLQTLPSVTIYLDDSRTGFIDYPLNHIEITIPGTGIATGFIASNN